MRPLWCVKSHYLLYKKYTSISIHTNIKHENWDCDCNSIKKNRFF